MKNEMLHPCELPVWLKISLIAVLIDEIDFANLGQTLKALFQQHINFPFEMKLGLKARPLNDRKSSILVGLSFVLPQSAFPVNYET